MLELSPEADAHAGAGLARDRQARPLGERAAAPARAARRSPRGRARGSRAVHRGALRRRSTSAPSRCARRTPRSKAPGAARGRQGSAADRGRPRAHQGRRDRVRAAATAWCSRATFCSSAAIPSSGKGRSTTGCAPATPSSALDVDVVVPGHGPLTDKRGVQGTQDYWVELQERASKTRRTARRRTSASSSELRGTTGWREAERLVSQRGHGAARARARPLAARPDSS